MRQFLLRLALIPAVLVTVALTGGSQPADAAGPVYVVPIHGEINPSLMVFLRRSVDRAADAGASHIIFDIDTFGGRVDSALQITTVIGSLTEIETIAFVPVRAEGTAVSWSAGALIALACDAIYMAPGTSMGAAAPVIQGPEGAQPADEKTVSAVRTQMAALAEKNNHPIPIAQAMVDFDIELIELVIDGEVVVVTSGEKDTVVRRAEAAGSTVEVGPTLSEAGKLLSLTAGQMERYRVSRGTVATLDGLLAKLGLEGREIVELEPTAADQAVSIVTSAGLTSLLILIGLIAIFAEVTSPGFGVPGTVGILCFAVIFVANGLLGRVGSVELLLFMLGAILLILEVFVIPGFGLAGISGIGLIAISLVLSLQTFVIPTFEWEWDAFHRNILIVVGNIFGALIAFGVIAHFVPKFGAFSRLVLAEAQDSSAGYTVQESSLETEYVGKQGVAVTPLRPSGKADFEDDTMVVESDGEYIEAGTPIEIASVNGNRITVRRID